MSNPGTPAPIRLAIVDDSELVRLGLRSVLSIEKSLRIVGEAGTAAEGLALCEKTKPDVVLLDIRLPDESGIAVCRKLTLLPSPPKVLMLTSVSDEQLIDEAIRAGAHGYLLKEIDRTGLIQAIKDVAAGRSILDPAIAARIMALMRAGRDAPKDILSGLSRQELRVLALTSEGKTNKEIAADLGLSDKTVKNYLANVFDKLGITRRSQAAALYAQHQAREEPRT